MTGTVEMSAEAQAMFKRGEISAVITRADGTVIDLGVIASSDDNAPPKKTTFLKKIGAFLWPRS